MEKRIYRGATRPAPAKPYRKRAEAPAKAPAVHRAGEPARFAAQNPPAAEERASEERGGAAWRKRIFRSVSNLLFYAALSVALLGTLLVVANNRFGGNILGYSAFTVLSDSMKSVFPKGSMVVVQHVEPSTIKAGDDISFMAAPTIVISHRVVNIIENYEGSGQLGFVTKGVENPDPDTDVVYAANVIGRVVYSIPQLGDIVNYLHQNLWMVAVFWALFMALSFAIRIFIEESKKEAPREKPSAGKVIWKPGTQR